MEHEMNFWDLCVAIGQGIGRLCTALGRLLGRMVRLTYRYWYIAVPLPLLAVAAAVYHTRPDNLHYRVSATALINGASLQQFEQAFAVFNMIETMPADAEIVPYMRRNHVQQFELFRIVDAKADGIPDYIDFKRKSNPKDTVQVQMTDRVCIRFCIPGVMVSQVPVLERAVLAVLNGNEALAKSYEVYLADLREEVAFNHRQSQKLDSLTSVYYYNAGTTRMAVEKNGGVNFYGDRKIRLFLNDIYKQQLHTQLGDYKLQLATAPVVLENHFTVDSKPVCSRMKCVVVYFLIAWCFACALAELIDKRKALAAWLKA